MLERLCCLQAHRNACAPLRACTSRRLLSFNPCRAFVEARERVQLTYPALTPAYLKGVNVVFARACALSFDRACL